MRRKNKSLYLILIVVILLGISIGYAAISRTLNITGDSEVKENTWDIHFENIQVTMGSVTAVKEPTLDNNNLAIDFSFNLDLPGDFYEFTVDVWNRGTIDAMLESITKTPELTEQQAKYLNYTIEYQNKEPIQTKQLVKSNEFVRYKVRVEYRKDINVEDLPILSETLNLAFSVNYVQSDGTGIVVPGRSLTKIVSGDGTNTGDEVCIGEECFYVMYSDEDSITMLSKYNLYVGGEYDSSTKTYIAYGEGATGKQNSNMLGYVSVQNVWKGTIKFSNTEYWESMVSSYPTYVYDSNSTLYSYVENYRTYLITLGVMLDEVRLITKEEVSALGCDDLSTSCSGAPKWVYSTSYWAGSAYSSNRVWVVRSYGDFSGNGYSYNYGIGCRPVIVIPKIFVVDNFS